MVRTRSQSENLSKDELIDEVLSLQNFKNDINAKFSELKIVLTIFKQNMKWPTLTCRFQDIVMSFYLSV